MSEEAARDALGKNRRDAVDLAKAAGAKKTKALLAGAESDLLTRLRQAEGLSGPGKGSFTATQLRATLAQVKLVQRDLNRGLRTLLVDQAAEVSGVAAEHTIEYLAKADQAFRGTGVQPLALKEAGVLDAAKEGAESSLLRRLASDGEPGPDGEPSPAKVGILQRYGMNTVEDFEGTLQRGLVGRKSWSDMRDDITEQSPFLQGKPASWAERIVRTEVMGAYNRAGWESVREADEQLGDMCKILSATFDDRTGSDSYAVHGQIRRPDEAFQSWFGLYQHPPNRPNDREVVVPHRVSWKIPAYLKWKDAEAISKRWALEKRKEKLPARPEMTTIPLNQFGRSR